MNSGFQATLLTVSQPHAKASGNLRKLVGRCAQRLKALMLDGNRVKQVIMLTMLLLLFGAYTFGTPYYNAFIGGPIVRRACHDQIQEDINKNSPVFKTRWKTRFLSKLKSNHIFLESEDQFKFSIENDGKGRRTKYICRGQLKFALTSDWLPSFGLFESPTFRTVHTVEEVVEYKR